MRHLASAATFVLSFVLLTVPATGEVPVSRGAAFKQVAYMYGVVEYCGLNSAEVYDGYEREARFIRRRDGLTDPTARWLRIRGMIAADLEYGDRGLGGYRNWCRTEGLDAARHFLAFREQSMAGEGP
ncbi:MAG TPA: hypothetical protein VH835_17850 [Dongiaceae bacterium]|jgi:hypothetical protein